ncbi:carbonic anhydrase 4b [Gadus morhua]|uniref:carbonic anhydrase 4b n=1 Tax=Gadus morhua TaxID=8049 RepID=UPI0011B7581B|nr:carbonic anhydrase 9-like [Gadus morhua]
MASTGPDDWPLVARHCSGRNQSPVNIVTRTTLPDERLVPLQLINYQKIFRGRIINNGHTVQLDLPSNVKIQGGKLAGPYKALQLHFHWGKDGGPGSEHTIDGERFPMEMHIVHIKEEYDTLDQAVADDTGVAVLGFFFQESPTPNKQYEPIISALKDLNHKASNSTLGGVSLGRLVPPEETLEHYFRYQGSLTTPHCDESVVWTLFETPVPLSRKQLSAFCGLRSPRGTRMVNTYRPEQQLNGRKVYYSGGGLPLLNTALLICSVLISSGPSLHSES